jgi:hypothetical protein
MNVNILKEKNLVKIHYPKHIILYNELDVILEYVTIKKVNIIIKRLVQTETPFKECRVLPIEKKYKMTKTKCEVYSRVVGYIRPVTQWNDGKQEEFKDRKNFKIKNDRKK